MIKDNKLKTLISSLIILLPSLYGVIMWNKLPDEMVSHMGLDGTTDALSPKPLIVFGMPAVILVLHLFGLWITDKDPKQKKQNKKALGMVFWILPVVSLFVSAMFYSVALQKHFNPMILVIGFMAFLFIFIGNYMPKCSQNSTLGIKIKWTLENAENWKATHRFSGKVWFICGFLLLPCMLLPEKFAPYVITGVIVPVVALPIGYSYLYYKKQLKEGNYVAKNVVKDMPKSAKIITVAVFAVLAVVLPVTLFTGDIDFLPGEAVLEIQADFYSDISVSYDSIDSIELRETATDGLRVGGFGSMRLLMGQFRNDEFGYYTRYTYTDDAGCIVITVGEETLVIGGKTSEDTKSLYDTLTEKIK